MATMLDPLGRSWDSWEVEEVANSVDDILSFEKYWYMVRRRHVMHTDNLMLFHGAHIAYLLDGTFVQWLLAATGNLDG